MIRIRHWRRRTAQSYHYSPRLKAWVDSQASRLQKTKDEILTMLQQGSTSFSIEAMATPPVAVKPVNTALPTITGTAKEGQTLTVSNGTWTGTPAPTFTRQWQRGTSNIAGATSATYTAVTADVGLTLRCVVTATNSAGSTTANSANTAAVAAAT